MAAGRDDTGSRRREDRTSAVTDPLDRAPPRRELVTGLLDAALRAPASVVYGLIAALVFAEAAFLVGFVLPGETAVLLGAALAATGRLTLPAVLAVAMIAAVAGDSVGYAVGRSAGPRMLAARPLRRHAERLDRAQVLMRRRGGWAVFLGRFTPFLRSAMPALAGLGRMPYLRFVAFNVAGAVVWSTGATLLGFFAGHSYAAVQQTVGAVGAVVLGAVALGLVVWRLLRRRRHPRSPR